MEKTVVDEYTFICSAAFFSELSSIEKSPGQNISWKL